jgi:hypothetical protein
MLSQDVKKPSYKRAAMVGDREREDYPFRPTKQWMAVLTTVLVEAIDPRSICSSAGLEAFLKTGFEHLKVLDPNSTAA